MRTVPIVEHFKAAPPSQALRAVDQLAKALREERPELALLDQFRELTLCQLDEGPPHHIDDLSEISRIDRGQDTRFYQDRARLRAGDADLVATCGDPVAGHEPYCRDYLGLGSPEGLRPRPVHIPSRSADGPSGRDS